MPSEFLGLKRLAHWTQPYLNSFIPKKIKIENAWKIRQQTRLGWEVSVACCRRGIVTREEYILACSIIYFLLHNWHDFCSWNTACSWPWWMLRWGGIISVAAKTWDCSLGRPLSISCIWSNCAREWGFSEECSDCHFLGLLSRSVLSMDCENYLSAFPDYNWSDRSNTGERTSVSQGEWLCNVCTVGTWGSAVAAGNWAASVAASWKHGMIWILSSYTNIIYSIV